MTNPATQELFEQIFGGDPEKLIGHLRSNFEHINKMDAEKVCTAARSLRTAATRAKMLNDPEVLDMLEVMRLRMLALWHNEYGESWFHDGHKETRYNACSRSKREYDSALGQDIQQKIGHATYSLLLLILTVSAMIFASGISVGISITSVMIVVISICMSSIITLSW